MVKKTQISEQNLESLLNWFSNDSDTAGIEYEKIRKGLVRFFRYRGCNESKSLADETINRVAVKVDTLDHSKGVQKITIFYGFAINVFREYLREQKRKEIPLNKEIAQAVNEDTKDNDEKEAELRCLKKCLSEISKDERILVTKYFSKEKNEKITLRKKIAAELGITPNALHVRVYRIRQRLRKCIENCLSKNNL